MGQCWYVLTEVIKKQALTYVPLPWNCWQEVRNIVAIKRFDIYSIAEITTLGLPRDRHASCYSILPCLHIQDFWSWTSGWYFVSIYFLWTKLSCINQNSLLIVWTIECGRRYIFFSCNINSQVFTVCLCTTSEESWSTRWNVVWGLTDAKWSAWPAIQKGLKQRTRIGWHNSRGNDFVHVF